MDFGPGEIIATGASRPFSAGRDWQLSGCWIDFQVPGSGRKPLALSVGFQTIADTGILVPEAGGCDGACGWQTKSIPWSSTPAISH